MNSLQEIKNKMTENSVIIRYIGSQESCLIESTSDLVTSKSGNHGTEILDFSIKMSAHSAKSFCELINTYPEYIAEFISGAEDITSEEIESKNVQIKDKSEPFLFTIKSVLSPNSLVSWAKTRDFLNLDTEDRIDVERLINAVSQRAEGIEYTNRKLKARDYEIILSGKKSGDIILPVYPVNSISRIFVDSDKQFSDDTEIFDYEFDSESGILYIDNSICIEGKRNVKIIYNAGFKIIPEDLQLAVIECVAFLRKRFSGSNMIGFKSFDSQNGGSATYELTLPVNAQRVFRDYRK